MDEEQLKKIFAASPAPPAREEARLAAVSQARREWEKALRQPSADSSAEGSVVAYPPWAVGGVAALIMLGFLASFLFWGSMQHSNEQMAQEAPGEVEALAAYEREKRILREMEDLFAGRLQFIVLRNGNTHIEVAPGPVSKEQAVLVELRVGADLWRIISYSGNAVQLEVAGERMEFDLFVAGDGEVIMAGDDFAWSSRSGTGKANISIEASIISG